MRWRGSIGLVLIVFPGVCLGGGKGDKVRGDRTCVSCCRRREEKQRSKVVGSSEVVRNTKSGFLSEKMFVQTMSTSAHGGVFVPKQTYISLLLVGHSSTTHIKEHNGMIFQYFHDYLCFISYLCPLH